MSGALVEIDDRALRETLKRLLEKIGNLEPAYRDIGEKWLLNTRNRYEKLQTGSTVDGVTWPALKPSTLSKKQKNTDKILVEEGTLRDSRMVADIRGDSLVLGSSDKRAAAHQFGMPKGYAGTTKKRGLPIPWGNIPARPFVTVSGDDEQDFLDIITNHLKDAFDGA